MSSRRILVVGSDQHWSIERLYKKYLSEAGVIVELFGAQDLFYQQYNKSIINKIQFRLGLSSIFTSINKQLLLKASSFKPDIVWIFKGMEIFPETINFLKSRNIRLVSYNPDNPFLFTGKGSGNMNVSKSIPFYDLHFSYSLEIEKRLKTEFNAKTSYLPFGFDIPDELYQRASLQAEILKCCFLGNPDKDRAKFILELAEGGVELDLFGNFWNRFVSHRNIKIYPPVYEDAFYNTLFRYRVQLNMMRIHNLRSHNMRSFEIPAIGGIQLAPHTPEHERFFRQGKEIFLYRTSSDCVATARELLALSAVDGQIIRQNARSRSLQSGYSYRHRANHALEVMNEMKYG